ncbi:hypothetical protein GV793_13340 [Nocardia cyriacigeorgica]|nr:hypothetical protein [Nocardia cyriacigeorgica]
MASGVNRVNNRLVSLEVYFGGKEQLSDAVFDQHVARGLNAVTFTADDLPGYAGALYDYCRTHPEVLRLATWHRLERGTAADHTIAGSRSAYDAKARALRAAQRGGLVALPRTHTTRSRTRGGGQSSRRSGGLSSSRNASSPRSPVNAAPPRAATCQT